MTEVKKGNVEIIDERTEDQVWSDFLNTTRAYKSNCRGTGSIDSSVIDEADEKLELEQS